MISDTSNTVPLSMELSNQGVVQKSTHKQRGQDRSLQEYRDQLRTHEKIVSTNME